MFMATIMKIVEQFNESTRHIQNALEFSIHAEIAKAQKELEKSATCIYQAIEWAIKNKLSAIYNDPIEYSKELKIIEGTKFPPKVNLFEESVTPSPKEIGIDIKIITDLKNTVRNLPEHSGFTPHFNSLIKVVQETGKIILNYIDPSAILQEIPSDENTLIPIDENWSEFYSLCDSFERSKNYILLIGPTFGFDKNKLTCLGLLDWSLIIDFDPDSEIDGLYNFAKKGIESKRKCHLLTCEDRISFSPYNTTYWLAANGLKGRTNTITPNLAKWNNKNRGFLDNFFKYYFKSFGDKPSNVIILWDNEAYIQRICDIINYTSGSKSLFIYAVPDLTKLHNLIETYEGRKIEIDIPKISEGILRIRNYFNSELFNDSYLLPSKDEEFIELTKQEYLWIEEDFEILYSNIIEVEDFQTESGVERENYYRGNQISWLGLHLHLDVEREKTPTIKKKIEKFLKNRGTERTTLNHHPGIGGTTVSRRVGWELRDDYPVLLLRKYRSLETIEKVYRVFELTKKAVFIIAEASVVNVDEINKLFNEFQSRSLPSTLLIVQRNEHPEQNGLMLEDLLTDLEVNTFVTKYKEICPNKKEPLDRIAKSKEKKERHPFFIGLTAFEEDFDGLQSFVHQNLQDATEVQKKILSIISLCYYFGQKEISAQIFSSLLLTPENSVIILNDHLNSDLLTLLINEESIMWRPIHYLVSIEILKQTLSVNNEEDGLWKNNLTELAVLLINLISGQSSTLSESESELLKRLFVYRNNEETLGRDENSLFSNFIENGLQSDEARLRILKYLTSSFPEESHYWAHLARFLSLRMKNFDDALIAISKAIELSIGNDSLLYHMKGTCLSSLAKNKMNKLYNKKNCTSEQISEIQKLVEESGENFEECRIINSSNEYGYISHIQLLIRLIDFSYSISKYDSKTEFLRNMPFWLQEKLDLAEELLGIIKYQTQMKSNNSYVEDCDLKLKELYENYSLVIEGWNNLLTKVSNGRPVIRRNLVWAYVRRAGSWNSVNNKDIEKILNLIEENIQDESSKGKDIYLWFQAARQTERIDINTAIDKIATWRAFADVDESLYYLGVLHSIQAIEGASISVIKAEKVIRELSERKRHTPYRTHCFEWYGKSSGLKRIKPYKEVLSKDNNNENIFNAELLEKLGGKISYIKGPEAGEIELACGLKAFFIPARGDGFSRAKDINKNVKFYLGFSNDGLRAYEVEAAD